MKNNLNIINETIVGVQPISLVHKNGQVKLAG
jgi:hypothetical protein